MKINKNTKIATFINDDTIEMVENINEHYIKIGAKTIKRYANSGVNVKDFALIGKLSSNDLLKHLEGFGFEVAYEKETEKPKEKIRVKEENLNIVTLEVRPIIQSGNDPFVEIMKAIKTLKETETLKIINIFVPIPLINVLESKGFTSWTNTISNQEFHTFFTKVDLSINSNLEKKEPTKGDFDKKLASFGDKVKEIEVRHLEMPEPMVSILEELEALPNDYVLLVNHKKVPQFLLPELEKRNYKWMYKDIETGYLLFIVFK